MPSTRLPQNVENIVTNILYENNADFFWQVLNVYYFKTGSQKFGNNKMEEMF